MTIELRQYQHDAVVAVHAAHGQGVRRPAAVLATGAGKSIIIAEVARTSRHGVAGGKRVVILAHREELVEQNAQKVRDVAPDLRVGVVQAGSNQVAAHVISASVQTLASPMRRAQLRDVGLVIVDECFPAGTLVGGSPIETLAPGDMVPSWDEVTGTVQYRPVVALMRRVPESLVRVELDTGQVIHCTPNHPILTVGGWCPAGGLWRGASVVSFTHDATASRTMRGVLDISDLGAERQDRQLSPIGSDVLFRHLPGRMGQPGQFGAHGPDESGARVGSDGDEQSHGAAGLAGEDGGDSRPDRAQAEGAPGQRHADFGSATEAGRASGLADRGHCEDPRWSNAVLVQRGHRAPVDEGGDRGRRGIPFLAGPPSLRPSKGESVVLARVVGVQVLEPGCDGTYDDVCGDGAVYNVEVDGTHTYLIDGGVVVHNCHHAVARSYVETLDSFGCMDGDRARALGVTATMARGDEKALGDIWQEIVYVKDTAELIAEGYLVRPVGVRVRVDDLQLGKVRKTAGDYSAKGLGDAIEDSMAPKKIVEALREHAPGRQTLLFAPLVHTAEVIRDALREGGFTAELVHGGTPKDERRRLLQAYRDGAIQVLCNAMVFTEGTDLPMTSCVVIARPTMSPSLFVQMVGRGLRLWPGKTDCIVLDVVGATNRHRLAAPVELFGEEGYQDELGLTDEETEKLYDDSDPDEQAVLDHALGLDELPAYRDGELVSEPVDLFEGSDAGWLRTYAGVWFLATATRYVAVLPRVEGGYAVVAMARARVGESAWVIQHCSELGYAMAHGTGAVAGEPGQQLSAWSARSMAAKLGLIVQRGMTAGEVRKMVTVGLASARIDGALPGWVRR